MRLPIVLLVSLVSLGSARAAAPQSVDFSHVRCEAPEVTKIIKDSLKSMTLEDGTPVSSFLGNNSKLTATTISAARDKLVCRLTLNYLLNGTPTDVRGRYTFRSRADGQIGEEFMPLY